jgi:hypothetical protein
VRKRPEPVEEHGEKLDEEQQPKRQHKHHADRLQFQVLAVDENLNIYETQYMQMS